MFELGALIAFGEALLALLWYRQANAQFSLRILGYDGTRPPATLTDLVRQRPSDAAKVLRAWTQPSTDPETEHWRLLMHRRIRLLLVGAVLLVFLPPLLGLLELDAKILSRGPLGLLWSAGIAALLLYWFFKVARWLIRYGRGEQLDARSLWTAVTGIVVVGIVLYGVWRMAWL